MFDITGRGVGLYCVFFLIVSITFCSGQDAVELVMANMDGPGTGTFDVPVYIKLNGNDDVNNFKIEIVFDPEILLYHETSLAKEDPGIAPSGMLEPSVNNSKSGNLIIASAGAFPVELNGPLLNITFEMITCPSAEMNESTTVGFKSAEISEGLVTVETQEGTITFPDCIPTYFVRSDSNADGAVDISDVVYDLLYLFDKDRIALPTCLKALDSNDDDSINISDPVSILSYLFSEGGQPSAPFPECGRDQTEDEITCDTFLPCEED